MRYHPNYAYHDTIALVSRYTTQALIPVKFGLLHHLAYDDVH